jgi:hypothetical protein
MAEVEEHLGPPRQVTHLKGDQVVAYYKLWQLSFEPNLIIRTRYYKGGYWPPGRPFLPLDRKIRGLRLGISKVGAERKVGKTEAWQILGFWERERIWYGNGRWKLSFRHDKLSGKQMTEQVTAGRLMP